MVNQVDKLSAEIEVKYQSAAAALRRFDSEMVASAAKADKATAQIAKSFGSVTPGADRATGAVRGVGQASGTAAGQIGQVGAASAKAGTGLAQTGSAAAKAQTGLAHTGTSAASAGSSLSRMGKDADHAGSSLDSVGKKAGGLDLSLGSVTKSAAGFGLGMAGIASAQTVVQQAFDLTINSAAKLDTAVRNISTLKPEIDTQTLTTGINDMSKRVAQSAGDLADSMYNIFSSIEISQEGALRLTEEFARGAVAAQTDAETFGTAVLGVMNAYSLGVEDAAHISDVFFNTVNKGVVTGAQLASSLGPVTQSAKAAGVELDELGAFIAGVTKEGGEASQNINNLNNLFQKITTADAQKQINALGVATVDAAGNFRPIQDILGDLSVRLGTMTQAAQLAAIQKIFPDAQARQGAQTIISQLDLVNAAIEENKTQSGSAARAYGIMSEGQEAQTKILVQNIQAIGREIGTSALPALTELTQIGIDFLRVAGEINETLPGTVDIVGTFIESLPGVREVKQVAFLAGAVKGLRDEMVQRFGEGADSAWLLKEPLDRVDESAQKVQQSAEGAAHSIDAQGVAAATALTPTERLAQILGITAEAAKKLEDPFAAATKRIDDLTGAATAAEGSWNRQITSLDAVASSVGAMQASINPQQLADWAARAHEMADASGIAAPSVAQLHRDIDLVAQGGPGAADAIARINQTIDESKGVIAPQAQATRDYAAAQGAAAKESLGFGGALETLGTQLSAFVNEFFVAMGRVPPAAQEAMQLTEEAVTIDLSQPGAELAISLANGFDKETVRIVDGAGNVIHEVKGTLSEADMSPEGVALMQKVASGVTAGGIDVTSATVAVVAQAAQAAGTAAPEIGTQIKAVLGLTDLTPEAQAILTTLATGIAGGQQPVIDNMTAIIGHLRTAANADLSPEGRAAAASFAAGLAAGNTEVEVQAAITASTPVDITQTTIQSGSPSKIFHDFGTSITDGLAGGISGGTANVTAASQVMAQSTVDALAPYPPQFGAVGATFTGEMTAGVSSGGAALAGAAVAVVQGAVAAAEAALGIASPSAVGFDIGVNLIEGMREGVESRASSLAEAATAAAQSAQTAASGSLVGSGNYSGGVLSEGEVRGIIAQASAITGISVSANDVEILLARAYQESGFNPGAVNNWDINAQRGTPSIGLMQTIGPTFSAHNPGGNIYDPLDNMVAALRYIRARYGGPSGLPGLHSGYAKGGLIAEPIEGVGLRTGTRYSFGEGGIKEAVIPMTGPHRPFAEGSFPGATLATGQGGTAFLSGPGMAEIGGVFDPDRLFQAARAVEAFNAMVAAGAPSIEHYDDYLRNLFQTFSDLAGGAVGQVAEDFSLVSDSFSETTAVGSRMLPTLRENEAQIARLDHEIARLNEELAYTDPYSERAAAIKSEIATLQAWRGQVQAGLATLDAEAQALEASKTALDGATEARIKYLATQGATKAFGEGAGVVTATDTALTENTAESGRAAYAELEAFIAGLKEALGPRAMEVGNYLRFLFFETLGAVTPEDRAAAQQRLDSALGEIHAEATAKTQLSAQTLNSAYTNALFDDAMLATLGQKGAALWQAIDAAQAEPSAAAVATVARRAADIEAEIMRLPASMRGPVLAEWQAAWLAFSEAPNDPAAQEALRGAVANVNATLALIPAELDKLPPQMRQAVLALVDQVKAGEVPLETAIERWAEIQQAIPRDFATLPPQIQRTINDLLDQYRRGVIGAEQFRDGTARALEQGGDAALQASLKYQDAIAQIIAAFHAGTISAEQMQAQIDATVAGAAAAPSGGGGGGGSRDLPPAGGGESWADKMEAWLTGRGLFSDVPTALGGYGMRAPPGNPTRTPQDLVRLPNGQWGTASEFVNKWGSGGGEWGGFTGGGMIMPGMGGGADDTGTGGIEDRLDTLIEEVADLKRRPVEVSIDGQRLTDWMSSSVRGVS